MKTKCMKKQKQEEKEKSEIIIVSLYFELVILIARIQPPITLRKSSSSDLFKRVKFYRKKCRSTPR